MANQQATVSFLPPTSTGGGPILEYIAMAFTGSPPAATGIFQTGASSPITVTGLVNGTAYIFEVYAVNAVGAGPFSAPSNPVTPMATVPTAPLNAVATGGNAQAFVAFTAPATDGGSAITSYTALSNPGGLTGTVSSFGPITVNSLINGTPYSFTVTATNAVGTGPASLPSNAVAPQSPPTVPSAPLNPSASAGNAQATVSFNAPLNNGGASITAYTATSTPGGLTASGASSPLTVTGLTNGVSYTFMVTATNSAGIGPASVASNSVTPVAPATVPGAPLSPAATAGNAQAFVTFQAPSSDGGAAITSYTATASPGGQTGTVANVGSITVGGLTNGTPYTFTVTATNSVGTGSASVASNSVTPAAPPTVPSAPLLPSAVGGNAQATISFSQPTTNGGAAITSYTATSSPGSLTASGSASPLTVSGLTNGVAYTFTVTATNSVGTGPASVATNSVTPLAPPTIPTAPLSPVATGGNTQAFVTFQAPSSDGGSAILHYTATSNPGGQTGTVTSVGSITVIGLTNGTAYTFTVTATNAVGTGPASVASNSVTPAAPATVPSAPLSPSAVAGNAQATVSFSAPVTNGGATITSYTATSSPGGFNASGSASPLTVTGLTNGVAYTFTVTATNSVGTGPASLATNSVTPQAPLTVPTAPLNPVATAGNAQAFVTFQAPTSDGGTAITGYTATSSPGGFTGTVATLGPITVTGLANATAYTFTVTATNSVGTSAASVASNSVTPAAAATVPSAPLSPSAVAGNAQATVSFSAPATNGGATITGYTATSSPGGFTASGASSPLTVTGLANGTAYTFTVTATNSVGTGPASVASNSVTPSPPPTVPSAPLSPSAVAGNAQATVSFSAPASTGGSPITSYTTTSSPGGLTASGAASPLTVGGLTNGVGYTFTVTATNAVGTGPASVATARVTPLGLPGAPTGATATAGNAQATVTFTAPSSTGGDPITGYTATSSPGGLTASGASSPLVVTGLTNGVGYTFTVTATTAFGTGPPSAATARVTPLGAPGAPTGATATPGNAQVSVAFTAPASTGGSPITSYTATSSPGSLTASGAASPLVVTGLTNGVGYTFTVTATNAIGTGSASAATARVTPLGMPGAPTGAAATAGNAQVSVAFTAPASTGGTPITGYTATSSPSGINASGASSPIVVTGLTNGVSYTFTVTATNSVGTGPASAPSNSVTPATVPGIPTGITATGGNTQASIAFTAPANGGSAITGYTATSSPGGFTGTASASPVVVTGLTNGTAYTFTITATNAVGTGAASSPSNSITPSTFPGAPTGLVGTRGNAQVSVAFTAPSSNGGAPITSYKVTSSGGQTASGVGSPLVVTGLTNGTAYTFTATATNVNGAGPASSPSASVTPATIPGAPTAVAATAGNTAATVTYTPPASNGGSAVTSYTATSSPGGITGSASSGGIAVSGLTNGTAYTFTVTATNSVGTGPVSAPSNSVTPSAGGFIIVNTPLAAGTVGTAYAGGPVVATGGVTPYTYSLASGSLPPGISLTASTGALPGTPTTANTYNPGFGATDSSGTTAYPTSTTVCDNEGDGGAPHPGGIASTSSVALVAGQLTVCLTTCACYEGPAGATYPTLRQTVTGASAGSTEFTTVTCTSGTATLGASTLVVWAGNSHYVGHVTASITDNVGNSYSILLQTNDGETLGSGQQGAQNQSVSVCNNATAGATTWTATPTGTEDYLGIYVMEFTGASGVTTPIGTYTGPPTGIGAGANNVNTGTGNMGTAPITLVGFVQNTGPVSGSGTAGTTPIAFTTTGTTTPNWDWGGPNNALVEVANVTPAGNVGATATFTSGNWTLQQAIGVIGATGSRSGLHTGRGLQTTNGNTCTLQTYIQGPDYTAAGTPINASQETDLWLINSPAGGTTTFQQWFGTAGYGGANSGDNDFQAFKAYQYSSGSTFVGYGAFTEQTGTAYAGVAQNTALVSGSITLTSAQVPCRMYGFCENTSSLGTNFVATPNTVAGFAGVQIEQTWGFGGGTAANTSCYAYWNITAAGTYTPSFNQNSTSLNCYQTVGWAIKGPNTGNAQTPIQVIPITINPSGGTLPVAPSDLYLVYQGGTTWNHDGNANWNTGGSIAAPNTNVLTVPAVATATSYVIQRSPDNSTWTTPSGSWSGRSFTDTTATLSVNVHIGAGSVFFPSNNWYYRVAAVNGAGQGPWSPTQSIYAYLGTADAPGANHLMFSDTSLNPGGTTTANNDTSAGGAAYNGQQYDCLVTQNGGYWLPAAFGGYVQWLAWGGACSWLNFDFKPITGDANLGMQFHCVAAQTGGDETLGSLSPSQVATYVVHGTLALGQWCSISIPYSAILFDSARGVVQPMLYKITFQTNGSGNATYAVSKWRYSPNQGP